MKTGIALIKSDITQVNCDAIVNAANKTLLGGGGVDGAIHRAAGPELLEECKGLGGCETGEAKMTQGYQLPARHVIHAVGPVWNGGKCREEELLAACYKNSLTLAQKHRLRTIAFPSISTGAYRFPIQEAAAIAVGTVKKFLEVNPEVFDQVTFVLFSARDLEIYKSIL